MDVTNTFSDSEVTDSFMSVFSYLVARMVEYSHSYHHSSLLLQELRLSSHLSFLSMIDTQPQKVWAAIVPMNVKHGLHLGDLVHVEIRNYQAFLLLRKVCCHDAPIGGDDASTTTTTHVIELSISKLLDVDTFLGVERVRKYDKAVALDGVGL